MHTPIDAAADTIVELRQGEAFAGFVARLRADGIIDRPQILSWMARLMGQARRAQAGEYAIDKNTTPAELLQRVVQGRVVG